jgi:ADP-ribose pyrophosphatase YjhB (NUDIX family)
MHYCSNCGATVTSKVPEGDSRPRYVCDACNTIHYQNPKIVAGCLPVWNGRLLLCQRAIEPRYGLWTLPAGFMENGESTPQAAARETLEEACAEVSDLALYGVFSIPQISQVYMMFLARMVSGNFAPGEETLATRLFTEAEIPWGQIAFPVVERTLKRYFHDVRNGHFPVHVEDIFRHPQRSP